MADHPLIIRRDAAQATLNAFADQPFEWGKYDCGKMLAAHLKAMGHSVRVAPAGTYKTAIGAKGALRRMGFRDKYPGAIALDAAGRTLWERLRAADKTIPAALRKQDDVLHLNADGRAAWTAHNREDNAARRLGAAPITGTATFTLRSRGAIPGLPAVESARSATVTFLPRRFWGVSASDALTKAQVIALAGSELADGRAKAFTANAAGQYVYVSYLASLGDPTSFKIGGFNEPYVKTIVSVTTAAGLTADYIVLRSLNKLTGAPSVEVQ